MATSKRGANESKIINGSSGASAANRKRRESIAAARGGAWQQISKSKNGAQRAGAYRARRGARHRKQRAASHQRAQYLREKYAQSVKKRKIMNVAAAASARASLARISGGMAWRNGGNENGVNNGGVD
jgi:hypothetical protein